MLLVDSGYVVSAEVEVQEEAEGEDRAHIWDEAASLHPGDGDPDRDGETGGREWKPHRWISMELLVV